MATIKKYIKPCITVTEIRDSGILCSSNSMDISVQNFVSIGIFVKIGVKGNIV